MSARFHRTKPARPPIHLPGDSPFLPPGNQWNARGVPVPDEEKVPAPERMHDHNGVLVHAAGALVDPDELARLIPESRLYQTAEPVVAVEEPEPQSAKPTRAKTRARKPGENRAG